MKVFLFPSILLFTLVVLTNCKQTAKKTKQTTEIIFFDPMELGAINHTSNLSIEARFSECGEWSGHKEKITIYADSNKTIHARYQVYPYNCDSLKYYYGNEKLNPILDKTVKLRDIQKRSSVDYIQRLTQAKIAERFPGHAGDVFSILKSDSTLFLQVYDNKKVNIISYTKLVTELFK